MGRTPPLPQVKETKKCRDQFSFAIYMPPKSHLMERDLEGHGFAGGEGYILFGGEIDSKKKTHGWDGEFQI